MDGEGPVVAYVSSDGDVWDGGEEGDVARVCE
jgi:hypothetical protein